MNYHGMKLGDSVMGTYHGVAYAGVITSYDGNGYIHITTTEPVTIYGLARDGICLAPERDPADTCHFVSRSEVPPTVRHFSEACLGGASIVR